MPCVRRRAVRPVLITGFNSQLLDRVGELADLWHAFGPIVLALEHIEVAAQGFDNVLDVVLPSIDASADKGFNAVAQRPPHLAGLAVNGMESAINGRNEDKGEDVDLKVECWRRKDRAVGRRRER